MVTKQPVKPAQLVRTFKPCGIKQWLHSDVPYLSVSLSLAVSGVRDELKTRVILAKTVLLCC